jgi:hypothetical protein
MNTSIRPLGLLAGSAVIAATLALAACNESTKETSPVATDTPTAVATTNSPVSTDGTSGATDADDAAEMQEHHRQQMDHDEMRRGGMGGMGPQQSNTPAPQPSGNQAMPMDHM